MDSGALMGLQTRICLLFDADAWNAVQAVVDLFLDAAVPRHEVDFGGQCLEWPDDDVRFPREVLVLGHVYERGLAGCIPGEFMISVGLGPAHTAVELETLFAASRLSTFHDRGLRHALAQLLALQHGTAGLISLEDGEEEVIWLDEAKVARALADAGSDPALAAAAAHVRESRPRKSTLE